MNSLQESLIQLEEQIKELNKQKKATQQKIKRLNTRRRKRVVQNDDYDDDDEDEEEDDDDDDDDDLDPISKALLSPFVIAAVPCAAAYHGIKKLMGK